jgi:outer membrane immunogenic protein
MATARGRLGAGAGPALVYATGGIALVSLTTQHQLSFTPSDGSSGPVTTAGSSSATRLGWTLGAGAELRVHGRWSVGAEYRHTEVDGFPSDVKSSAVGGVTAQFHTHFRDDALLARVNYRFQGLDLF